MATVAGLLHDVSRHVLFNNDCRVAQDPIAVHAW